MTPMSEIKSNEDLTKALVSVKRSEGGHLNSFRLTKKHAKENDISWDHFLKSIKILNLKVEACGVGHRVSK